MQIYKDIVSLQRHLKQEKYTRRIGLVPTMGALHKGHLSLIEASKKENDLTVCSIFVNPKQFNNSDDLKSYPRHIDQDSELLEKNGCDILFVPSDDEIYKHQENIVHLSFGYLEHIMEAKYRPGHFNGVGIVVLKLFNIAIPDKAYFGQKDLQQFVIIKNLVEELNINVELRCMPIIREPDGLAMSSRNMRLDKQSRQTALIFSKALNEAEQQVAGGAVLEDVKQNVKTLFAQEKKANLEYFEIVNAQDLIPVTGQAPQKKIALCIAGYVDGIRLIDNVII